MSLNIFNMIKELLLVGLLFINIYSSYGLPNLDMMMDRDNSREYGYICISDKNNSILNYKYKYIHFPQIFIDFFNYLL